MVLLEEEYSEKCLVPTVTFSGSKAYICGWMSAEGVRELCFINAAMNSHTTVWCNTKTWNRRCCPPLVPCIIGPFFSMTMKIFILPRWKSFSWHVFHSVLTLTSWAKLPIKDQSIQGGRPPGVIQDRCETVSWTCTLSAKRARAVYLKFWRTY